MKTITFNPVTIMYDFTIAGYSTRRSLECRDEAEFYFISTYKNYSDYIVSYCNDGCTFATTQIKDGALNIFRVEYFQ